MRTLDNILEKIEEFKLPIKIKGKEYNAGNPYILHTINNMLNAGLTQELGGVIKEDIDPILITDCEWEDPRLMFWEDEYCFMYDKMFHFGLGINDQNNRLDDERNEIIYENERKKNG